MDDDEDDPDPIRFGRALALDFDGAYWTGHLKLAGLRTLAREPLLVEIEDDDGVPAVKQRGIRWLVAHHVAAGKRLAAAILAGYPALRARLTGFAMPGLTARTLRKHVELRSVHFHDAVRGRTPYLGYELRCSWDDEHGLGAMMHGTRLVELGGADTAILEWIADRHATNKSR
jgi:hypothetical protein